MEKNITIYRSDERGQADYGWLKTRYSFSFSNYFNPERIHFGVLRVLNDDFIAGGGGFDIHPHENMEIITIPLEGELLHRDSMGNEGVIRAGDIQVMSAGSGIKHAEMNASSDKDLRLLQIWIFPREKDVRPRYDQAEIPYLNSENQMVQILSPNKDDEGVWIHQDAWFSIGTFTEEKEISYIAKKEGNGFYIFVLNGNIKLADETLSERDAVSVTGKESIELTAMKGSRLLIMDIPMSV